MIKKAITDYKLYRWRYHIAIAIFVILVIAIFGTATTSSPGGISQAEIDSTVGSYNLGWQNFTNSSQIVDLPYKLLQKVIIAIFGLSNLTIKLPSLIIGTGTIICLVILISSWLNRRAGILTGILALANSQLLFLSQHGTPKINLIFLATITTLLITKIADYTTRQTDYKLRYGRFNDNFQSQIFKLTVGLTLALGLLLYSQLGIYIVILAGVMVLIHPHLRLAVKVMIKQLTVQQKIIATTILSVLLLPLIASSVFNPAGVWLELLDAKNFGLSLDENLKLIAMNLLGFLPNNQLTLRAIPLIFLGATTIAVIGIAKLLPKYHKPAQATILVAATSIFLVSLFNPNLIILMLVPIWGLIGFGIELLFSNWYGLFPRNPYARIAGIIPISLLVGLSIIAGLSFYIDFYKYTPGIADLFRNDLTIINQQLKTHGNLKIIAHKTNHQLEFYQILAQTNSNITVSQSIDSVSNQRQLVTKQATDHQQYSEAYHSVLTDNFKTNSDRFYVYQKSNK